MKQSNELRLAINLCQKVGDLALKYWPIDNRQLKIDRKADGSEVTQADRECESMLRKEIAKIYPDDGFLGEEEGESPTAKRRWIIDPIDGTFNYSKGLPIFSTLLALESDGEIVLGVINAPATLETLWAEKNCGAYKNGERIHASTCNQISQAFLTYGGLNRIIQKGYWAGFTNLVNKTYRQKGPGDYLSFALVFEGKADLVIEAGVKAWDLAPMKIIAEESGCKYDDLAGGSSIYTGSCLITNPALYQEAIDCFELKTVALL